MLGVLCAATVTHPFGDHSRAFGFRERVLFLLYATDFPDYNTRLAYAKYVRLSGTTLRP